MNPKTYFTPANGYNPRYGARRYNAKTPVNSIKYSVENVWAAAMAAQRVNGEYLKEDQIKHNEDGSSQLVKSRNRDVMMSFLSAPDTIKDEDRAAGQECRKYLQNDLTFRALKGKLNDFDSSVSRVVAIEGEFDSVQHRLELAVIACLPQSRQRSLARSDADSRLARCAPIDTNVGDKVDLEVEVVRGNYSQQWGIFWITAVTKDNKAVFFSSRENYDAGNCLTIRGTVKAQRDGKTQLNRVKVL